MLQVKSLRGHEQDIINVVSVGGSSVDWEHPVPPAIVSLSQDGVVHAWDVAEVRTRERDRDRGGSRKREREQEREKEGVRGRRA